MIERLSRNKRNIVLALLGLLVLWFAWSIRSVVNPLLIGYLLAFILHPLVERVQQLGFSRRTAVNLVFLGGFLLSTGITLGLVLQSRALVLELLEGRPQETPAEVAPGVPDPAVGGPDVPGGDGIDPGGRAADDPAPEGAPAPLEVWLGTLQERLDSFAERVNGWFGTDFHLEVWEVSRFEAYAKNWVTENKEEGLSAGVWVLSRSWLLARDFVGGFFALGSLFFLVPLYCYYFLFELERLHGFVVRYIPKTERSRLAHVGREIGEVIAAFFRGRLSVCLVKGLTLSLGLWLAGVDYALLFGMVSGFLSLIPFIGAAIGFVIAFVFAVVEHGVLGSFLRTGLVYMAAELFEGYVLVPRIMGESLGLHPLVVIFAIFAGGAALGTLGVVIALPLTASLVLLVRELVLPAMQRMADEDPGPPRRAKGAPPPTAIDADIE